MMTLRQFSSQPKNIPATTAWYLADLGEALGKQELFIKQSPQRLKVLREHALIESAVSSSRIEGVIIDQKRVDTIIFGNPLLQDRNEEEVWGYRNALKLIHDKNTKLPVNEDTILMLHSLIRGEIWDAGKYKEKNSDIIEKYPDGRQRIRFKTISATDTPSYMIDWNRMCEDCLSERWVHPLIAIAASNLDFLCIHPFRDGNGRVSRLLLLLQLYHIGFQVGHYISIERLIEQNKERYYETLEQSSHDWHSAKHNPWPYIDYILYILKSAYMEFENRAGQTVSPRGSKTELIINSITRNTDSFRVADIQKECPGVSVDLIRRTLKKLRASGHVECLGRGQNAKWQKV